MSMSILATLSLTFLAPTALATISTTNPILEPINETRSYQTYQDCYNPFSSIFVADDCATDIATDAYYHGSLVLTPVLNETDVEVCRTGGFAGDLDVVVSTDALLRLGPTSGEYVGNRSWFDPNDVYFAFKSNGTAPVSEGYSSAGDPSTTDFFLPPTVDQMIYLRSSWDGAYAGEEVEAYDFFDSIYWKNISVASDYGNQSLTFNSTRPGMITRYGENSVDFTYAPINSTTSAGNPVCPAVLSFLRRIQHIRQMTLTASIDPSSANITFTALDICPGCSYTYPSTPERTDDLALVPDGTLNYTMRFEGVPLQEFPLGARVSVEEDGTVMFTRGIYYGKVEDVGGVVSTVTNPGWTTATSVVVSGTSSSSARVEASSVRSMGCRTYSAIRGWCVTGAGVVAVIIGFATFM
ncbi:hypothetical protein YB2330_004799 [Saitoella coloradoensis]